MEKLLALTKEDFENARRLRWDEEVVCNSIVIIPDEEMHDSGFMMMAFAALDEYHNIIGVKECGSDLLHFDGIGGYGEWKNGAFPAYPPSSAWSVDCLPCGYLRFICRNKIKMGRGLSSFEVFGVEEND